MNWSVLLIAFGLAVLVAGWLDDRLMQRRGHWASRRRVMRASLPLPSLILVASAAGMAWTLLRGPGHGENMRDLAVAAIATIGALFALVTFVGGLLGASLVERRRP